MLFVAVQARCGSILDCSVDHVFCHIRVRIIVQYSLGTCESADCFELNAESNRALQLEFESNRHN